MLSCRAFAIPPFRETLAPVRRTDLEEQLAGSQSAHRAAEQAARSAEARASGVAHQAASAAGEAAEREREWQAQLSVSEGRRRQAELGERGRVEQRNRHRIRTPMLGLWPRKHPTNAVARGPCA